MIPRTARSAILSGLFLSFFLFPGRFVLAHDQDEDLLEGDHLTHYELDLKPGQSKTIKVTWDGQPLKARWIFLLSARMSGKSKTTVELHAPKDDMAFAVWDWTVDGEVHTQVAELPRDGFYNLTFFNSVASSEPVNISFQFDQSCECTGKISDLESGVIVFQQKVDKDDEIHFSFTEPAGADFAVWAGVRNQNPLTWKEGFDLVAKASKSGDRIKMDYSVGSKGIHYFFVESIFGVGVIMPEYTLQETFGLSNDGRSHAVVLWVTTCASIFLSIILLRKWVEL